MTHVQYNNLYIYLEIKFNKFILHFKTAFTGLFYYYIVFIFFISFYLVVFALHSVFSSHMSFN